MLRCFCSICILRIGSALLSSPLLFSRTLANFISTRTCARLPSWLNAHAYHRCLCTWYTCESPTAANKFFFSYECCNTYGNPAEFAAAFRNSLRAAPQSFPATHNTVLSHNAKPRRRKHTVPNTLPHEPREHSARASTSTTFGAFSLSKSSISLHASNEARHSRATDAVSACLWQ